MASVTLQAVPPASLLMLDLQALTTPKDFPGVSEIPSGFHIILLSAPNEPLRSGYVFYSSISSSSSSSNTAASYSFRYSPNPHNFEFIDSTPTITQQALPKYTQPPSPVPFSQLTNHIFPSDLIRVFGVSADGTNTDKIVEMDAKAWAVSTTSIPNYIDIMPSRTWDPSDSGVVRTERARDASWYLGQWLPHKFKKDSKEPEAALSEIQLSFIVAVMTGNPASSIAYESYVRTLLKVREGMDEDSDIYEGVTKAWRCVYDQLRTLRDVFEGGGETEEGGVLGDVLEVEGWFVRGFRGVWRYTLEVDAEGEPIGKELRKVLTQLKEWGEEELEWIVDVGNVARKGMKRLEDGEEVEMEWTGVGWEEGEEYAPVVVDESELKVLEQS
ncbi:hypothetical protein BJ508DRAFT_417886 [Ascobolus immersus RN42]|uniref:AAR2-domain-containing protein n=1 Tax=Ascobolus immersus RN42 TaxID=1160509 RepID=A0A3N4HV80_ASCIM|nr:hypothetical protein BJ508DRAFT_417886 [Ascobolus immersus RN42]